MAVKAYVLIEARVGKTGEVVAALRRLRGVESADSVSGPYDAIAILTTTSMEEMADLILSAVEPIEGIFRVVTCIAISPTF
jgi:DNA-binding Lrp family transcriptional regulator